MKRTSAKRAIIYARQSSGSDDEDRSVSLEQQIESCRTVCKQNGYAVVLEVPDRNVSGRTYWHGSPFAETDRAYRQYCDEHIDRVPKRTRKGLAQVIDEVKKGNADVLVCYDHTRLARPVAGSYLEPTLMQELHNVTIHTVTEGVQLDSLGTRLARQVTSTVEDEKIRTTTKRSTDALRTLRDEGSLYRSPTWYGMRSVGNQKAEWIKVEADVVVRVFTLLLSGKNVHHITCILNREGVRRRKGTTWQSKSITEILRRPEYAGYQRDTHGILIKSKVFQGIISLDTFHKAQVLLKDARRIRTVKGLVHPLSGLLFCGQCGRRMVTERSNGDWGDNWYYGCVTTQEGIGCKSALIRANDGKNGLGLDSALMPLVARAMLNDLRAFLAAPELRKEIDTLTLQLGEYEELRVKAIDAYSKKLMDIANLTATLAKLTSDAEQLKRRRQEAQERLDSASHASFDKVQVAAALLGGMAPLPYKGLIKRSVQKVSVYTDRIAVTIDGDTFDVPRIHIRNSRVLPHPVLSLPEHLTAESKIVITYTGKGLTKKTLYQKNGLVIRTQGLDDADATKTTRQAPDITFSRQFLEREMARIRRQSKTS